MKRRSFLSSLSAGVLALFGVKQAEAVAPTFCVGQLPLRMPSLGHNTAKEFCGLLTMGGKRLRATGLGFVGSIRYVSAIVEAEAHRKGLPTGKTGFMQPQVCLAAKELTITALGGAEDLSYVTMGYPGVDLDIRASMTPPHQKEPIDRLFSMRGAVLVDVEEVVVKSDGTVTLFNPVFLTNNRRYSNDAVYDSTKSGLANFLNKWGEAGPTEGEQQ